MHYSVELAKIDPLFPLQGLTCHGTAKAVSNKKGDNLLFIISMAKARRQQRKRTASSGLVVISFVVGLLVALLIYGGKQLYDQQQNKQAPTPSLQRTSQPSPSLEQDLQVLLEDGKKLGINFRSYFYNHGEPKEVYTHTIYENLRTCSSLILPLVIARWAIFRPFRSKRKGFFGIR